MELRETRWGEEYMAGCKTRAFLPKPDELRRDFGHNAVRAASAYGRLRPITIVVMGVMAVIVLLILYTAMGHGPGFPGWAVLLMGLDVFGAAFTLSALMVHQGVRIRTLRNSSR
jgi:hypothetical protein